MAKNNRLKQLRDQAARALKLAKEGSDPARYDQAADLFDELEDFETASTCRDEADNLRDIQS